jgi:hypothetical protein
MRLQISFLTYRQHCYGTGIKDVAMPGNLTKMKKIRNTFRMLGEKVLNSGHLENRQSYGRITLRLTLGKYVFGIDNARSYISNYGSLISATIQAVKLPDRLLLSTS